MVAKPPCMRAEQNAAWRQVTLSPAVQIGVLPDDIGVADSDDRARKICKSSVACPLVREEVGNAARQSRQEGGCMSVTSVCSSVRVRRFSDEDRAAVLRLIDEDRLPGQPAVSPTVLSHALRAEEGLENAGCDVLVSADDAVLGAVSYGVPKGDGAGVLLWLHCMEDEQGLAQNLIDHTLTQLGRRTVHAYAVSTAMAPAGLPMRKRPGTRRALEACGFSGTDRWRYLHHSLDTLSPRLYAIADLIEHVDGGWQLDLRERDGTRIGEACVSVPVGGVAALEWVTLAPEQPAPGPHPARAMPDKPLRPWRSPCHHVSGRSRF